MLLCLSLVVSMAGWAAQAAPGVDEIYQKPGAKRSWGEILSEFLGQGGYGKGYALVVGISEFEHHADLPTASDPIKVKDFLLNEAGFDYVHLLTEDKVSVERLTDLMVDEFPALLGEEDRFVFYWSGHGVTRGVGAGARGYLPVHDSPADRFGRMVSMQDIQRWDGLLPAKQVLYLLDSCFGGLAGSVPQSGTRISKIDILSQPSRHLLTAGTATQQTIALDSIGGSVFTYAVLEGLRGKADSASAYPRDGVVTLNELKGYVESKVDELRSGAGWDRMITPQIRDIATSTGEFFFVTSEGKEERLAAAGSAPSGRFDFGVPVPQGESGGVDVAVVTPSRPLSVRGPTTIVHNLPGTVHLGDEEISDWEPVHGPCYDISFEYRDRIDTLTLRYDVYGAERTILSLNGIEQAFATMPPPPGRKRPNYWWEDRVMVMPVGGQSFLGPVTLRVCSQPVPDPGFAGDLDDFQLRDLSVQVN